MLQQTDLSSVFDRSDDAKFSLFLMAMGVTSTLHSWSGTSVPQSTLVGMFALASPMAGTSKIMAGRQQYQTKQMLQNIFDTCKEGFTYQENSLQFVFCN